MTDPSDDFAPDPSYDFLMSDELRSLVASKDGKPVAAMGMSAEPATVTQEALDSVMEALRKERKLRKDAELELEHASDPDLDLLEKVERLEAENRALTADHPSTA